MQNALVERDAGVTISFHALRRSGGLDNGTNGGRIAGLVAPELSYAPLVTRYLDIELSGSWGGAFVEPASSSTGRLDWGPGGLSGRGKISVPALRVLKLGATASYTFNSRVSATGWQVPDCPGLAPGTAWGGLLTLRLQDVTTPAPNIIVNAGKHLSRLTPLANETYYGAAAELQGTGFAIFAEAYLRQPDMLPDGRRNREVLGTNHGQVRLTPGIAVGSPASAFLKLGYTIGLGGESLGSSRADELVVGLGYATPFGRQPRPAYGRISGTVTDADSGAPLAATVTFPDHPGLGILNTNPATGAFKTVGIPVGAVTVKASADGYESRTVPLMVEDHRLVIAALRLPRAVAPVSVSGSVSDRKTGLALAATVMVAEGDSSVRNTDPSTGTYETRLMPGAHSLVVESPGYLKQTAAVLVERGRPLLHDFRLVKEQMVITLQGIYFDFDKATIRPESRPALEDAARILMDNPSIDVEVRGHTDNQGSDKYNTGLSEQRAQAVVAYLVQDLGIEAGRLTARGFGESRPVADNTTDEGRALNRRVEFLVLGETSPRRD